MPRMVTVMVLPPGEAAPYTTRIDGDDSNALVRLVEGNLGTCSLPVAWRKMDWYGFCDDEAMIKEHKPELNRFAAHLGHAVLRGPIVIVKTDYMGETRSLKPADVADLEMRLVQQPTREALEQARFEQQFWNEHPSGMAIYNPSTGAWE